MGSEAVEISYELGVPLNLMSAATPFATGSDLLVLLGIVGELAQSKETTVQTRKVDWRLADSSTIASAALISYSDPDVAAKAALRLVRGFAEAEAEEQLPHAWSLKAGKRAAQVAARLGDSADTGMYLSVKGPEEAHAQVTRKSARHLRSATDLRITTYGSVVGVLGRVTAHGKSRTAALWSDLTGRRVEVIFGDQHVEDMRNAWAHAHVEVTGVCHENLAGQVLRVNMDSLEILDTQKVSLVELLPRGSYPAMTGGLSAAEYLKVIRGED